MLAEILVTQFERMVQRDGGSLTLISATDEEIRIGYRQGSDPDCADGACILPPQELQELMRETAARRQPGVKVIVQPVS